MCFLNVIQQSRFELSRRYHQIQLFVQQVFFSQTWIIFSGEFSRRWKIISLHGYYDTFGKLEIIKFSVISIWILWIRLNWQKQNQRCGLRHKYWMNRGQLIPQIVDTSLPSIPGRWCFRDGSWKEGDTFSRQGWFSTLEKFDGLLGARNVRASLSPLHSEMESLLWAMKCMRNLRQYQVTFATNCSQLVKMVSEQEE